MCLITRESRVLLFFLQRHIDPIPQEHYKGAEKNREQSNKYVKGPYYAVMDVRDAQVD